MSDYERIATAIRFICDHKDRQPSLEDVAAHLHLSPSHFQRLFSRWAGVSPKRFLQVLTVEHARQLLREPLSLLDVSTAVGLSSGSRLYDHFVQLEAVTPGEYRSGGEGLIIEYAAHDTPFGKAFIAVTQRGISRLSFLAGNDIKAHLADLSRQWPHAQIQENRVCTGSIINAMFAKTAIPDKPLCLHVSGTNFQINVWRALLRIPPGAVISYSRIAQQTGHPGAARAVGRAVGANPVALLIPCHRVIRESGALGGYHWGEIRKHAIHAWEMARYG